MFIVADLVSLKQETSLFVGTLVFMSSWAWKKFYNLGARPLVKSA